VVIGVAKDSWVRLSPWVLMCRTRGTLRFGTWYSQLVSSSLTAFSLLSLCQGWLCKCRGFVTGFVNLMKLVVLRKSHIFKNVFHSGSGVPALVIGCKRVFI